VTARRLRVWLIATIVLAAVISFVGTRTGNNIVNSLGFAIFVGAVGLYGLWRRAVRNEHAARVFDREAKTDETRTRPDQ
jgi:uncharacterized membrane protein YfcA